MNLSLPAQTNSLSLNLQTLARLIQKSLDVMFSLSAIRICYQCLLPPSMLVLPTKSSDYKRPREEYITMLFTYDPLTF